MTASTDNLAAALNSYRAQAEELRAKLADIAASEGSVLDEELAADPSKNPLRSLGSRSAKLRKRRDEAERELLSIESEILPRLEAAHTQAAKSDAESFLEEQKQKLAKVNAKAPAAWSKIEQAWDRFVREYEEAKWSVAADREALDTEAVGALDQWRGLADEWEYEMQRTTPDSIPRSLAAAVQRLLATGGPLNEGPRIVYRTDVVRHPAPAYVPEGV